MFKRIQIIHMTLRTFLLLSTPLSLCLDASDPCSDRKFCGNLQIVFSGAGENTIEGNNKVVDFYSTDTTQFLNNFAQKSKNSRMFFMTSDRSKAVTKSATNAKKTLGSNFTQVSASHESFEKFLKNDVYLESIKKSLARDPECQELMRLSPEADISKFIKVDVMVSAHSRNESGFKGLPVWPKDSDAGSVDEYTRMSLDDSVSNPQSYVNGDDFKQLRNVFPSSVMGVLSTSCDAADVGNMIISQSNDSCSCYLAMADSGINTKRGMYYDKGAFNSAYKTVRGDVFTGKESLQDFIAPTNDFYKSFVTRSYGHEDTIYSDPVFALTPEKANPFDSYSLTSANVYSRDILKNNLASPSIANPELIKTNTGIDVAYAEVLKLSEKQVASQDSFRKNLRRNPESLKAGRELAAGFYNNCIFKPAANDLKCLGFKTLLDDMFEKQKADSSLPQQEKQVFIDPIFLLNQVRSDLRTFKESPLLEGKNDDPVKYLGIFKKVKPIMRLTEISNNHLYLTTRSKLFL